MPEVANPPPLAKSGHTERKDNWWVAPLVTAVVLSAAGIYMTWRAIANAFYDIGYGSVSGLFADQAYLLSPLYSPTIIIPGMPSWLSPAFLILWAPGGFRLTCYYYRKAYYRAFLRDPAG